VEKTNAAIRRLEGLREAWGDDARKRRFGASMSLVSNASGALLHQLYWDNLTPRPTQLPTDLVRQLERDFGSVENFVVAFTDVALTIPGSGWALLSYSPFLGRLVIQPVSKHDQYHIPGAVPVLVCDVWEHAYYLDHPADRRAYLDGFWGHVNWPVVAARLQRAMA
jgi:Fe-Mn family superoxide dismutase